MSASESGERSVSPDIQRLRHNVRLDRIVYLPIKEIRSYERKLHKRSDAAARALAASVAGFGIVLPILIDEAATIIAGEGIVEAARSLGYTEVPTLRVEHLDADEVRLLRIALNKLGEQSQWDRVELAAEFTDLLSLDVDLAYEVTGFETPEIDNLIHAPATDESDPDDEIIEPGQADTVVSRLGDIWLLGPHRVLCASSLDPGNLAVLMEDQRAAMVMTDAPYNVKIAGNVSGFGKTKHREFMQASGEMTEAEFTEFLTKSVTTLSSYCQDGALLYLYMDWKHMWEMLSALRTAKLSMFQLAVWVKRSPAMGAFYRSQHELCFVAKKGSAAHRNNIMLGRFGRSRSNCWSYAGVNSFGRDRDEQLAMHPTCKNVSMLADAIRDASHRGEIVLDGFLGSGSTLIAAERTGRVCRGLELDPIYVDVILKRWERVSGTQAVLSGTGETFDAVASRRANDVAPSSTPSINPATPEITARPRSRPQIAA